MKKIMNILVVIVSIQFLLIIYLKPSHKKESLPASKALLSAKKYSPKDEKNLETFNQKIENEMLLVEKQIMKVTQHQKITQITHLLHKIPKISQKKSSTQKKLSKIFKLIKYAKKKLGQKYVWGATGPKTFDCSGFTQNVFLSSTGIKIPRVSRDQAKVGKLIKNLKKLKVGDMVFFDTQKRKTGKVNHVGIYLDNGNFIHASSARKKIIITNFNKKPFYKKRFLWARRIIENPSS